MGYTVKSKLDSLEDTECEKDIISNIVETVNENKVVFVRLQFVDILGMPKNIVIPVCRLEEALEEGMPFDGSSIAGYATIEESDKIAKPDPHSFVILPECIEKRKTAKINCDVYEPDGKRFEGDTKYVLEKIVDKAREMGFIYNTGPECEFFLFKKEGDNSTIIPNDSAGYFDLSHRDLAEGIRADISIALDSLGIKHYVARVNRPQTNGKVERFFLTYKTEYAVGSFSNIKDFIKHYNEERLHMSLNYKTPKEVWDELISV